jgi:hypothetical protein
MENDKEHMLKKELAFMHTMYEKVCVAYKKLATEKKLTEDAVHDMSRMYFNNIQE